MNLIDSYLEELHTTQIHADFHRGEIRVTIERPDAPSVCGSGGYLENAVRDALENARLGRTISTRAQAGERIYEATITQRFSDGGILISSKRFIAGDAEDAERIAQMVFTDRPGFSELDVRFVDIAA